MSSPDVRGPVIPQYQTGPSNSWTSNTQKPRFSGTATHLQMYVALSSYNTRLYNPLAGLLPTYKNFVSPAQQLNRRGDTLPTARTNRDINTAVELHNVTKLFESCLFLVRTFRSSDSRPTLSISECSGSRSFSAADAIRFDKK